MGHPWPHCAMPNRLADAASPYLLQHAGNPVDWRPWDAEALELARREDRPIFLSIGYAACHWCHVMAHESFEDPTIARLLNEHFVPIKVDREERPDLDQLYMEAVMALSGHGGWPMSVFLTPRLEPFFGGTYWPPRPRGEMPGFGQVLAAVADAWQKNRQELIRHAGELTRAILGENEGEHPFGPLDDRPLQAAEAAFRRSFDPDHGGFGAGPKFPQPIALRLLLRRWRRTGREDLLAMVTTTLDRMAAGGIYDHLGGGFHRYTVDARWLVPHFEKMLYDNALLAGCYLEAWQATGRDDYARVVRETLDYVLRDMTDAEGGFYGTEDADSEGEEGKFYLWTPEELASLLGPETAKAVAYVFDVTAAGNFEGRNILNRPKTLGQCAKILGGDAEELAAQLGRARATLLAARSRRVRPGRDEKILVSWNGLMIESLARAGAALGEPRYLDAAAAAADFLLRLRSTDGRLLHGSFRGQARQTAFLDDYAALAGALVTLYETRFEERWIDAAVGLAEEILARFADRRRGGFFFTADDQEPLIARRKDLLDSSTPSASGLATLALLRLGRLCGREDCLAAADEALASAGPLLEQMPHGLGQMLLALDMRLGPSPEIVILGAQDDAADRALLGDLFKRFIPNQVFAYRPAHGGTAVQSPHLAGLFEGKQALEPGPTAFICENQTCAAPISGREALLAALAEMGKGERMNHGP
jgi:uncharacterized protein YyaL (SSP411 family)